MSKIHKKTLKNKKYFGESLIFTDNVWGTLQICKINVMDVRVVFLKDNINAVYIVPRSFLCNCYRFAL